MPKKKLKILTKKGLDYTKKSSEPFIPQELQNLNFWTPKPLLARAAKENDDDHKARGRNHCTIR